MTLSRKMRAVITSMTIVVLMILTACGGGSGVSVDERSSSAEPTTVPEPTVASQPPVVSKSTMAPSAAATSVPPTIAPTATPEPPRAIDEFGFYLGLDRGAYVVNLPGNTDEKGMLQLEYSGVNVILSWVPKIGATNESLVAGTFGMLQDSQPGLTFETVSESSFNLGLESGLVIGFKSEDTSGDVAGGGLIGAWNCLDEQISFTIMVTGQDASLVQLRFNRLVNNFRCSKG